ncbi:MAG TPA: acyl-CoA dehydrogenase family protein [Pyrinomonadaceae bacterium]|jgi:acyl-CoA dehydrogenase|nr:acyl-CoA dehydrogenase family protein [Pyrinomonadaceae bacterium]
MDSFIDTTPFFTSEHRALASRITQLVEREVEAHAADDERDPEQALRDYVLLLAENDLLRFAVPTPGQIFDLRAFCLIRESLSYSSSIADLAFVMQGLGTYAISLSATEHVRDFWLARARTGRAIAAFALTEPDAGSDVAGLKTAARREDDSYIIDGRKRFISNAGVADFYTVFARTGTRDDGRAEISAFIVSARMPGFSVSEKTEMLAPHPIGELEFRNCKIPAEDMIGNQGDGLRLSLQTLDMFRASVGAAACGMARRALDESLLHAKAREQFGKPLAEHQLVQEKLADMATELDAARLLVYRAAFLKDAAAGSSTREASEAKLFATEAAARVVDQAVQIHGGSGLVRGSVVERLYRDVRALRIYEGTSEIQKLIIANQLLKD